MFPMEGNNIDDHSSMEDLLEESWFFGNLLISPKRPNFITRCYSDPCPSSSNINNNNNISLPSKKEKNSSLVRAPSLPKNFGREIEFEEHVVVETREEKKKVKKEKKSSFGSNNSNNSKNRSNKLLARTKTMPSSMRNVRQEENETVKMIQSDILPPRHNKGSSRYRPPRIYTDVEGNMVNSDGSKEMRRRYLNGKKTLRRSTSELEIEEVQGFKDLGFTFDNKELLSPSVVNILPGLQEKRLEDTDLENKVQRPYLSEAWLDQSFVRIPAPNWASTRSSDDMKAQIKFWARSVASNVHLEC